MIGRAPIHWALHGLSLRAADTQLTGAERAALRNHAIGRRRLVEIGVMHGASTRLLCDAMAPDGTLTAIDPFPAGRLWWSFEFAVARREVGRGPARRVVWVRQRSEDAARSWSGEIDCLFIDGDHSWGGIERDWTLWSGFVATGGVVLLHDSRPLNRGAQLDSVRYTQEVILRDRRFAAIEAIDTLTVMQRR